MRPSTSFTFESKDGTKIFVNRFDSEKPSNRSRHKILLIIHGFGEHGGRYKHFAHYLADDFDRFYAIDLRGHGRSSGIRGHSPSMEALQDDVLLFIDEIQNKEKDADLYLFAHSFGGLLALFTLFKCMTPAIENSETKTKTLPFKCAMISAPLLEIAMPVNPTLKKIVNFLNNTLSFLQLFSEINPMHLSHDPVVTEAYIKDRLVHSKITPRMYMNMTNAMEWVKSQKGQLSCPIIFLVPGDDHVVSTAATKTFFDQLEHPQKELIEYPGFYHEIVNEVEKEKVFEDIKNWMKRQVKS